MPHSWQQFEQCVTRLEVHARHHPTLFRLQVAALVAVGLLAIPLAVFCSFVLLLLSLLTVFAWAGGVIDTAYRPARDRLLAALFALRLYVHPPRGIELCRAQAPRLFELLDDLTRRLQAPRCHHVLLDDGLSAGVVVFPRWGPLGWQRHYLVIGMPLFMSLSPEHFAAVLAHELAHLSRRHGHFDLWLARAWQACTRFTDYLEENDEARFGMNWFFRWYLPLLAPHDFVLERLHEIEADGQTTTVVGAQASAEALLMIYSRQAFLCDGFWREISALKATRSSPPCDLFARMQASFRQGMPLEDAQDAIAVALDEETDLVDPHPALRDRLALLGYIPQQGDDGWTLPAGLPLPGSPIMTAAEALLDNSLDTVMATCNQAWWLDHLDEWVAQHHAILNAQQRLDAGTPEQAEESAGQLFTKAKAVLAVYGEDEAIPLFRQALAVNPGHLGSHLLLGQLLLKREDDAGIEHLHQVITRDIDHARQACKLVYDYLVKRRRPAEADAYADRGEEIVRQIRQSQRERNWIHSETVFHPHTWSDEEIAILRRQLAWLPMVKEAYLVKQEVGLYPEKPHYVLGVVSYAPLRSLFNRKARWLTDIVNERVHSRREFTVYTLDDEADGVFMARWTDIRGALVFRRERDCQGKWGQHAVHP
ncbi:MAG: M48 family metallopeptidase [Armatimonadota bacterium]